MAEVDPRGQAEGSHLPAATLQWLDQRALAEGLTIRDGQPNRSAMLRRLIEYGREHMPPGWTG